MVSRLVNPLIKKSFFLFGARGTGKSTWLAQHFTSAAVWVDLLDRDTLDRYLSNPGGIKGLFEAHRNNDKIKWIIIDEVQKIPALLDNVHKEIENKRFNFALTGSSARKLKRTGANLLAGRAGWNQMFPFTSFELGAAFDLQSALSWGTLPSLSDTSDEALRMDYLRTYSMTYLREEIMQEQLARNIQAFRNFLEVAAQMNCQIINYSKIAKDIGVEVPTVQSYFEILEDTYTGTMLPPFDRSIRKRQRKNPKFYFFDTGVLRSLTRALATSVVQGSSYYGNLFEHWVVLEFLRYNEILKKDYRLSYLRTKDDAEIDLILERPGEPIIAVEIKSSKRVDEVEVGHMQRLAGDLGTKVRMYYLSLDPLSQKIGKVDCVPWQQGVFEIMGL